MRFDLVDLRLFVSVASFGSLTQAAEHLPMALAAASARIKSLEESLRSPLFERHNRGVTLTPQGEVFLERAVAILRETEELKENLLQFSDGTRGTVRLLANTNTIHEFVPQVMMEFLVDNPKVRVMLDEFSSDEIIRAVKEGQAEIGLISGEVDTRGLDVQPFMRDRLVVVAPENHPLTTRAKVRFYSISDWDFIGLSKGSSLQSWLDKSAMLLGLSLQYRIFIHDFETICRLVSANAGISILPESSARRISAKIPIAIIPIDEQWADRECHIAVRNVEKLTPPARKLYEKVIQTSVSPP